LAVTGEAVASAVTSPEAFVSMMQLHDSNHELTLRELLTAAEYLGSGSNPQKPS